MFVAPGKDDTMFDQWIVDSADDFYNDIEIPSTVKKVLFLIYAERRKGKTIIQIRDALNGMGYEISKKDVRGVLSVHEQYTGVDMQLNWYGNFNA